MNRKRLNLIIGVLLGLSIIGTPLLKADAAQPSAAATRPDLDYLKAVNQAGPPQDPQLLFLLMAQYASANRHAEGAEFFSARLEEFEPRLPDSQKALYLSVIALLRAQHAHAVPLLRRIGWVKETIAMLDRAKRLSDGQIFVVNWVAGTVRAQLPNRFHQRKAAQEELQWCVDNVEKAPPGGWLREVYFQLARLASAEGDKTKSEEYLRRSGYTDLNKPIVLMTPFSEDRERGHAFAPKRIAETVPGRVYALSGFEFTEYYFGSTAESVGDFGWGAAPDPAPSPTSLANVSYRVPPRGFGGAQAKAV